VKKAEVQTTFTSGIVEEGEDSEGPLRGIAPINLALARKGAVEGGEGSGGSFTH